MFTAIALLPLAKGHAGRWWALPIAGLFLLITLVRADWLGPLNRVWTAFGILLGKIVGPVAAGVVFFGVMTPVGWLARLAGKDFLRLRFDRDANSYWLKREPPGPEPETMKHQF